MHCAKSGQEPIRGRVDPSAAHRRDEFARRAAFGNLDEHGKHVFERIDGPNQWADCSCGDEFARELSAN
jgi:hypothetical protein